MDVHRPLGPAGTIEPTLPISSVDSTEDNNNNNSYNNNDNNIRIINTETGMRLDGRRITQPRKLFIKCAVVSEAKGSAFLERGATQVMCSIYGKRKTN